MKQKKQTKKQESGRSMIEMVGVLAVMGLITAGAFVLITSAMSSQKVSRVDDDVSAIVAGTRLLYNGQTNFQNLTDAALETLGFGSSVKNPWGGTYGVAASKCTSDSTDSNECFTVSIKGFTSQSTCNGLMKRAWAGGGTAGGSTGTTVCASVSGNPTTYTATITYGKVQ